MGTLLNGSEKLLFDNIAVEVTKLVGVEYCYLWKFNAYPSVSGGDPDCLYGEPADGTNYLHYTQFRVLGFYKEPEQIGDATDQGLNTTIEGQMYFVRKNLEQMRIPIDQFGDLVSIGDIVQIFRSGHFWYFDLKEIKRTGWINDS